jgi:tetratricopeptide (TPR) repeat protein
VEYEDFFIQIGPFANDAYAVSARSPAGEETGRFGIPVLPRLLSTDAGTEQKSPRHLSVVREPSPSQPEIGTALFRALFKDELLTLYHESLSISKASGHGLRIRLLLDPRDPDCAPLHDLPWELLCRPDNGDFLALCRSTPVVRFLPAHRPSKGVRRPGRLRILAVASLPSGLPFLDVQEELRALETAWEGQDVEVVRLERADRKELREALLAGTFHVLHFLGHGVFAEDGGTLFFEQPSGAAQAVGGRALSLELKDFEDLRLIVLNACDTAVSARNGADPMSGVACAMVLGGIPAVVAMRRPISDRAALSFARTLYERLAAGDPVDTAVGEGRLAIHRIDEISEEWATPVLFLRSSDGCLFSEAPSSAHSRLALLIAGVSGVAAALLLWFVLVHGHSDAGSAALARNNLGVALVLDGRDSEARKELLKALAIDPRNGAALSNLSAIEERGGDLDAALRHAQQAVASWSGDAVLHFNLGSLLSKLGRDEEALASLGHAVEIEPSYAEARNELGLVYLRLDRPGDARRELLAALRMRPDLAFLHKNFARAALAEGRSREAIGSLTKALALYGITDIQGRAEATYWMAVALAADGKSVEACGRLERLTRLQSPSEIAEWAPDAAALAREKGCRP